MTQEKKIGFGIRRAGVPFDVSLEVEGTLAEILQKYVATCADEFCGICMPCRYGTKEWKLILNRIVSGQAEARDEVKLKTINQSMKNASLCPLGLRSPFLIDALFKYFGDEMNAMLNNQTLEKKYTTLPQFRVIADECDICASLDGGPKCIPVCPARAITVEEDTCVINQTKCFRCDLCTPVCPTKAIVFC